MKYLTKCEKIYNEKKDFLKKGHILKNGVFYNIADEMTKFEDFLHAKSGEFNGFDFVDLFHEIISKNQAIFTAIADEEADVLTPFGVFHAGSDGITCYFFSEKPTKTVRFNRSIYYF